MRKLNLNKIKLKLNNLQKFNKKYNNSIKIIKDHQVEILGHIQDQIVLLEKNHTLLELPNRMQD